MITVQEWRHATIATDEDNVQRDRKAVGAGLEHVRLARWKVDLPPTAPVYDASEPTGTLDGRLRVNIAALAVATMLAGQVRWVRVEPVGRAVEMVPTLKDLFYLASRPNEFLLLGVRVVTSGKIERRFLRPSDLLAQDRPPNLAPSTWSPWRPDGIFVAGLPRPSPRDAVRKVVAAWITRGRVDRLPWEPS